MVGSMVNTVRDRRVELRMGGVDGLICDDNVVVWNRISRVV